MHPMSKMTPLNGPIARLLATVIVAIGCTFSSTRVEAALLVRVDPTDLSVLTFTTTMDSSEIDFSGTVGAILGITLLNVLDGNVEAFDEPFDTGTIDVFNSGAGDTRGQLNRLFVDDFEGGFSLNDLNFYNLNDDFSMWMFDTLRALVGTAVIDVSPGGGDFLTNFRAVGSTGDIVIGNPEDGIVIGQWSIVPEPSSLTLLGLGLAVLPLARRRSRA